MTHRDINIKMAQMMKDQSGTEDAGEKTKGGDKEDVGRATSDMVKKLERRKRMLEERLEELDDRIRWRNFIARSSEVSGSKASVGEESELEALEAAFAEFTAFRYGTAYSEAFSEAPDLSLTKHEKVSRAVPFDVQCQVELTRDLIRTRTSPPLSALVLKRYPRKRTDL